MTDLNVSLLLEEVLHPSNDKQMTESLPLAIFIVINNTCLSSIIGFLGLVANVINLIVFYRHGLNSSINISLFVMAISDVFTIIFVLGANLCFNPYIGQWSVPVNFPEVFYVTGGWPAGVSYRIRLYINVYTTAERCLCILFPLKIKTIITPFRSRFIIALIVIINTLTMVPEYSSIYMDWRYDSVRNESVLGIAFRRDIPQTQGVTFLMHVFLVVIGLLSVTTLTSILVSNLRRQTKWRLKSSSDARQQSAFSSRDRKSQLMVIVVATSMVICYIPLTCVSLVSVFEPQFSIVGKYSSIFANTWGTIFIIGMTNSSSNILIYYKMNSKFKTTLQAMLSRTRSSI
ncbi:FMRFamide receptor-like [Biomphalaria glabrata]|uniref:FMRFamide receptor-like n=1 Tax=Biomphalaria glabrata TaxID=6526 RepID=A0A9U8E8C0_BIOGL|nr:FMRFamide receptor-like [Biomphalaria glabrata]